MTKEKSEPEKNYQQPGPESADEYHVKLMQKSKVLVLNQNDTEMQV